VSKRHQASRRRTYGRRQHELHQRSAIQPEENIVDLEPALEGRGRGATYPTGATFQPVDRSSTSLVFGFVD
jgi:hypothetical protein